MVSEHARKRDRENSRYISILNVIQGDVDPTQVSAVHGDAVFDVSWQALEPLHTLFVVSGSQELAADTRAQGSTLH